jgi:DNA-binding FadR family transcriptional regulator
LADQPKQAKAKAAAVADDIRSQIASGTLSPGDSLPPEATLRQQYEVSPPTMRAALHILQSEGLLRIQRGVYGGARVQALDVDVLARQAGLYLHLDGSDLLDLLEALRQLQPGAVQLAAERHSKKDIAALRVAVERTAASANMREFGDASADFVLLLLEASGNKALKLFALVISSLIREELHRELDAQEGTPGVAWNAQRFGEVVDLIELGEGEAAAALWRAHLIYTDPTVVRSSRAKKMAAKRAAAPRRAAKRTTS